MVLVRILDIKAQSWADPIAFATEGAALRSFGDAVNQEGQAYNSHAEDFSLWHVADFLSDAAVLQPVDPPLKLAEAEHFKD